jgi:hypothetical protein
VAMATRHRNLKTIVVSAPADMAGPPPSITKKKKFEVKNLLVCQLGLHLLALLYRKIRCLLLVHSPST